MFTIDLAANHSFIIPTLDGVRTFIAGLLLGQGETHDDALSYARAWTDELAGPGFITYELDAGRLQVARVAEGFEDLADSFPTL